MTSVIMTSVIMTSVIMTSVIVTSVIVSREIPFGRRGFDRRVCHLAVLLSVEILLIMQLGDISSRPEQPRP